jgi:hypothetical protein
VDLVTSGNGKDFLMNYILCNAKGLSTDVQKNIIAAYNWLVGLGATSDELEDVDATLTDFFTVTRDGNGNNVITKLEIKESIRIRLNFMELQAEINSLEAEREKILSANELQKDAIARLQEISAKLQELEQEQLLPAITIANEELTKIQNAEEHNISKAIALYNAVVFYRDIELNINALSEESRNEFYVKYAEALALYITEVKLLSDTDEYTLGNGNTMTAVKLKEDIPEERLRLFFIQQSPRYTVTPNNIYEYDGLVNELTQKNKNFDFYNGIIALVKSPNNKSYQYIGGKWEDITPPAEPPNFSACTEDELSSYLAKIGVAGLQALATERKQEIITAFNRLNSSRPESVGDTQNTKIFPAPYWNYNLSGETIAAAVQATGGYTGADPLLKSAQALYNAIDDLALSQNGKLGIKEVNEWTNSLNKASADNIEDLLSDLTPLHVLNNDTIVPYNELAQELQLIRAGVYDKWLQEANISDPKYSEYLTTLENVISQFSNAQKEAVISLGNGESVSRGRYYTGRIVTYKVKEAGAAGILWTDLSLEYQNYLISIDDKAKPFFSGNHNGQRLALVRSGASLQWKFNGTPISADVVRPTAGGQPERNATPLTAGQWYKWPDGAMTYWTNGTNVYYTDSVNSTLRHSRMRVVDGIVHNSNNANMNEYFHPVAATEEVPPMSNPNVVGRQPASGGSAQRSEQPPQQPEFFTKIDETTVAAAADKVYFKGGNFYIKGTDPEQQIFVSGDIDYVWVGRIKYKNNGGKWQAQAI